MKKKWYAISLVFLLLTGCVPSETPVQEKVPDDRVSSLSAATPEESLGSATPQDVSTAWTEHVDIQRNHTASLRDGSPVPQQRCRSIIKETGKERPGHSWRRKLAFPNPICGC